MKSVPEPNRPMCFIKGWKARRRLRPMQRRRVAIAGECYDGWRALYAWIGDRVAGVGDRLGGDPDPGLSLDLIPSGRRAARRASVGSTAFEGPPRPHRGGFLLQRDQVPPVSRQSRWKMRRNFAKGACRIEADFARTAAQLRIHGGDGWWLGLGRLRREH